MKKKSLTREMLPLILKIIIGSIIFAAGIQWLFAPVSMVSGGATGVAMIANLLTGIPTGLLIILINIPIFIISFKRYGMKFILLSLIGTLVSSIAIDIMAVWTVEITRDPFLATIFGGLVTGVGLGIVYSTGATTGGMDIVAKLLREKRPYMNYGTFVLILDAIVVAVYAVIFRRIENAMYTVLAVFIYTQIIDLILYGSSQSKLCHIISAQSSEIKGKIVETLNRGVTIIEGRGAYSGEEKQILLCVVKRQQIVEIKNIVKSIDTSAFVIVSNTRDVFGEGFGDISIEK